MVLSVYLHKEQIDVLNTFGSLSEVVDKILTAYDNGLIDIENKPECQPRDGAGRYNVVIKNETYINLLNVYGIKSKRISLRRLLYWFVDNEIYDLLNWEPVNEYINSDAERINKKIDVIIAEINRLEFYVNCKNGELTHAKDIVEQFRR